MDRVQNGLVQCPQKNRSMSNSVAPWNEFKPISLPISTHYQPIHWGSMRLRHPRLWSQSISWKPLEPSPWPWFTNVEQTPTVMWFTYVYICLDSEFWWLSLQNLDGHIDSKKSTTWLMPFFCRAFQHLGFDPGEFWREPTCKVGDRATCGRKDLQPQPPEGRLKVSGNSAMKAFTAPGDWKCVFCFCPSLISETCN